MPKALKFRKLKMSHANDVFEYGSDPEVTKYLSWNNFQSLNDAKQYIKLLKIQKNNIFAVTVYGKMIGTARVFNITDNEIEIDLVINRNYWGMGIGKQVLLFLIKYATLWYKGRLMVCYIDPRNTAATKLLNSCGFKIKKDGNNLDKYVMNIL